MIQHVRVDFRLVHGQIIHSWLKSTNSNTIFILDDELMSEPYKMKMFKICVPPVVNLERHSNEEGIQALRKHAGDKKYRCLVLLRDILPCIEVCEALHITSFNIGETIYAPDKKRIANSVYVTEKDVCAMNEFLVKDCSIDIRQVSDSRKSVFTKKKLFTYEP